jgi:hypothetical protein
MKNIWQKNIATGILISIFAIEVFLPMVALAELGDDPVEVGPRNPIIQRPPGNIDVSTLPTGGRSNPQSIKADCSTKGVSNFVLATLFKALNAGGGADKTSILGFKPPEIFPDINYDVTLDVGSCVTSLLETGARYAFARFKKRLLDRLTDDTIAWINGETDGRPRFFNKPFSQILLETADQAAGDALMDLGLGEVCSPFRARINLELNYRQGPVQDAVRCTISQVIDNFEEFGKDFSKGNWLAYSESLKPQNNPWGATLIAKDAAQRAYQKQAGEKQLEILAGRGYVAEKKCTAWTLYADTSGSGSWTKVPDISADISSYPYPDKPPTPQSAEQLRAESTLGKKVYKLSWRCSQVITTVPGDLYAAANSTAFTKDYDLVVNSDDLTPYLEAIFDAAMNRLIKKGADGLMAAVFQGEENGSLRSDNTTGRAPTVLDPINNKDDKNFIDNSKDHEQFANPQATLAKTLEILIASSTISLTKTSSTLKIVLASSTQFKTEVDALATCESNRFGSSTLCTTTQNIQTEANDRYNSVKNTRISLNNAKENIDLFSKLDKNYSEPILSAAVDTMSGIYRALEEINSALIAEKKNIEDKMKTTDVKNQLMLCQAPSQPYSCKP